MIMNLAISAAQIGQWYMNFETDDQFFVTGYDQKSRTIEVQSADGDVSEIDEETWGTLPLRLSEQPELDSEAVDDLDSAYPDDLNSPVEKIALGGGVNQGR